MSNKYQSLLRMELLDNLSHALGSIHASKRLHDPDRVLAKAAAEQLVGSLEQSGFVLTKPASLAGMVPPPGINVIATGLAEPLQA